MPKMSRLHKVLRLPELPKRPFFAKITGNVDVAVKVNIAEVAEFAEIADNIDFADFVSLAEIAEVAKFAQRAEVAEIVETAEKGKITEIVEIALLADNDERAWNAEIAGLNVTAENA